VSKEEINRQAAQSGSGRRGGQPAVRQDVTGMVGNMQDMMLRMNQIQQGANINSNINNAGNSVQVIAVI
jgi:hypothetical protein